MEKGGLSKTILINIGILVGFLLIIDILIITGWETRRFINYIKNDLLGTKTERVDPRVLLPNYVNADWAKEYFKDFNKLKDDNYESYVGWRKEPFESKYINIDSFGDRVTPQRLKKSDSVETVIFLGGSTMWGTGSPDNGTIPAFFANGSSNYYTINYGESAYRAMQSYIYLVLKFNTGEKANWVITYDGVNDAVGFLDDNNGISTIAESRMKTKLKQKEGMSKFVTDLTFRHFFLGPIENSVSRIKNKRIVKKKMAVILTDERIDIVARAMLDSWLLMKDISNKNRAKFLAVLQPNVGVGNPKIDYLTFPEYEQLLIKTYKPFYKRVKELLNEEKKYSSLDGHILDLTKAFDGNEIFYIDWCHVSPNGNKIIARKIKERIEELTNN